jgi:hypothetical protein
MKDRALAWGEGTGVPEFPVGSHGADLLVAASA